MSGTMLPKVLMNLRRDGNSITLRIDQDRLLEGSSGEFPVVDLILFGCNELDACLGWLEAGMDQAMDYLIHKTDDEKWVRFKLESSPNELTVNCAGIIEVGSEYTLADWTQKCRRLIRLNKGAINEADTYRRRYRELRGRLEVDVNQGLGKAQRRLLMADPNGGDRNAVMLAQREIYQRICNIISEVDGNFEQ